MFAVLYGAGSRFWGKNANTDKRIIMWVLDNTKNNRIHTEIYTSDDLFLYEINKKDFLDFTKRLGYDIQVDSFSKEFSLNLTWLPIKSQYKIEEDEYGEYIKF